VWDFIVNPLHLYNELIKIEKNDETIAESNMKKPFQVEWLFHM